MPGLTGHLPRNIINGYSFSKQILKDNEFFVSLSYDCEDENGLVLHVVR